MTTGNTMTDDRKALIERLVKAAPSIRGEAAEVRSRGIRPEKWSQFLYRLADDLEALSAQPSPDAAQRNQQLQVAIENGVLRISIGVDLLCHAVQVPWKEQGINWKIVNKDVFAKALATELEREDEEGSTPVHFLFDKAADEVLEQGADGAEEFQDDEEEDDDE